MTPEKRRPKMILILKETLEGEKEEPGLTMVEETGSLCLPCHLFDEEETRLPRPWKNGVIVNLLGSSTRLQF